MIPMPQPVVRGQVLTADTINNIITSLRMLRPIGGAGILVEESINGVIFKLAERPKEPSFVFDHRWKCSLISSSDSGGNPQYDLAIRPGSFYLITEEGLEEQVLELSDNLNEREEGGWESTGNALGSDVTLFLAVNDQGDGYKLILGTEEEGWTPLFKIATITGAGSSYDIPVITQLLLQDVYFWAIGSGAVVAPQPWEVRFLDGGWYVYEPKVTVVKASASMLWTLPLCEGYNGGDGWIDLASLLGGAVSAGDLTLIYSPYATGTTVRLAIGDVSLVTGGWACKLGTFSSNIDGSLSFQQALMGAMVFDVSRTSPAYVVNITGDASSSSGTLTTEGTDISADATACYIGRTHWLAILMIGGTEVARGDLMLSDGVTLAIATQGLYMQFRTPVLHGATALSTEGATLMPSAKIADLETIATQETQARVTGIGSNAPAEDTAQGSLYAGNTSSTVWVATPSSDIVNEDFLLTEVETANEESSYQDYSGVSSEA